MPSSGRGTKGAAESRGTPTLLYPQYDSQSERGAAEQCKPERPLFLQLRASPQYVSGAHANRVAYVRERDTKPQLAGRGVKLCRSRVPPLRVVVSLSALPTAVRRESAAAAAMVISTG